MLFSFSHPLLKMPFLDGVDCERGDGIVFELYSRKFGVSSHLSREKCDFFHKIALNTHQGISLFPICRG